MNINKNTRICWFTEGGNLHAPTRHRAYIYKNYFSKNFEHIKYERFGFRYRDVRKRIRDLLIFNNKIVNLIASVLAEVARLSIIFRFVKYVSGAFYYNRFIFLRCFPSRLHCFLLLLLKKRIYFDIDDALYLHRPTKKQDGEYSFGVNKKFLKKLEWFLPKCSWVIVSNENLFDNLVRLNNRIMIIPTVTEVHHRLHENNGKKFIIGWIGAPENQKYLMDVFPGISRFLDNHPDAELQLVTKNHWKYDHDSVKLIEWSEESWLGNIADFTVALAPLDDSEWSKGKMQFKAIQCAAAGVPVIAGRTGFYHKDWLDGINIVFAENENEYEKALQFLYDSKQTRINIGDKALNTVLSKYTPEKTAILWEKILAEEKEHVPERFLPVSWKTKIKRMLGIKKKRKRGVFRESSLAHKYLDGLTGLEIGESAHNPFGLDTINVDVTISSNQFKQAEAGICGKTANVDIVAMGDKLPFKDEVFDFVISSHVLEHFPDPIAALKEWQRVIRRGGYIFMIIPHKDRTFDKNKATTAFGELIDRHNGLIPLLFDKDYGHVSFWTTESFVELLNHLNFHIIEVNDKDDKVGNGFTVVLRR